MPHLLIPFLTSACRLKHPVSAGSKPTQLNHAYSNEPSTNGSDNIIVLIDELTYHVRSPQHANAHLTDCHHNHTTCQDTIWLMITSQAALEVTAPA